MPVALRMPGWPAGNLVLSAVPPEERQLLAAHFETVELRGREALYAAGTQLAELHFPVSCVVATIGIARDGSTAQYAVIGNESFVGLNALLGDTRAVGSALVQTPGRCYRIAVAPMAEAFQRSEALRRVVLRCASSLVLHTSQTSLCNAHHTVEQRLCSWLLQTLDRVGPGEELRITHELVAMVLGVRREAVTLAAMRLQARKAIRGTRGRFTLLDRAKVEKSACECYALLRGDVEVMTRDIAGAWNG